MIYVGCAGWSISTAVAENFAPGNSHLERWGKTLNCVEINSSFYRPHQRKTYERWAATVPEGFRFSVKIPKAITHEARLKNTDAALEKFMNECQGLGGKLGVLLVQLPPSFRFDKTVEPFFQNLKCLTSVAIAVEPRHVSWFDPEVETFLESHDLSRVAADPAIVDIAAIPGGSKRLAYYRWHGSPKLYYSRYSDESLTSFAQTLRNSSAVQVWAIFDNTAEGHAVPNALDVLRSSR